MKSFSTNAGIEAGTYIACFLHYKRYFSVKYQNGVLKLPVKRGDDWIAALNTSKGVHSKELGPSIGDFFIIGRCKSDAPPFMMVHVEQCLPFVDTSYWCSPDLQLKMGINPPKPPKKSARGLPASLVFTAQEIVQLLENNKENYFVMTGTEELSADSSLSNARSNISIKALFSNYTHAELISRFNSFEFNFMKESTKQGSLQRENEIRAQRFALEELLKRIKYPLDYYAQLCKEVIHTDTDVGRALLKSVAETTDPVELHRKLLRTLSYVRNYGGFVAGVTSDNNNEAYKGLRPRVHSTLVSPVTGRPVPKKLIGNNNLGFLLSTMEVTQNLEKEFIDLYGLTFEQVLQQYEAKTLPTNKYFMLDIIDHCFKYDGSVNTAKPDQYGGKQIDDTSFSSGGIHSYYDKIKLLFHAKRTPKDIASLVSLMHELQPYTENYSIYSTAKYFDELQSDTFVGMIKSVF